MRIDVLTLFPEMFAGPFAAGIVGKAIQAGSVEVHVHPLRQWAKGRHAVTDDYVFGGGPGMALKPEPVFAAMRELQAVGAGRLILCSPQGRRFDQGTAERLAAEDGWVLLCGRYEGVDERVRLAFAPEEISLGDFVLSGGEIAAMAVMDAVVRLLPGVLAPEATRQESFASGLLEGPQYTRPAVFAGMEVPRVLRSGDHAQVARWRRQQALRRTWLQRPDLLWNAPLDAEDRRLLVEVMTQEAQRMARAQR